VHVSLLDNFFRAMCFDSKWSFRQETGISDVHVSLLDNFFRARCFDSEWSFRQETGVTEVHGPLLDLTGSNLCRKMHSKVQRVSMR
jgi:hypothetical protein